ncbi:MAG: response regulator [Cyanobacteriota bacterium]|nr:response regulator [Cyanobacteriota bacterium]
MSEQAILCVDDEPPILNSLKEQLKRRLGGHYLYETAESAEEAWEAIEELDEEGIQVIAIVSDWLMPGMKGDEFLIQVHQRFPDIATILLTGQAREEAVERAIQQGNLRCCLRKPWTEEDLGRILTSILGSGS